MFVQLRLVFDRRIPIYGDCGPILLAILLQRKELFNEVALTIYNIRPNRALREY
jgi:hypothetical protein